MKKVLYFILLAAELFVDVLFMMALANSSLYIPIAIAVVATLAALTFFGLVERSILHLNVVSTAAVHSQRGFSQTTSPVYTAKRLVRPPTYSSRLLLGFLT